VVRLSETMGCGRSRPPPYVGSRYRNPPQLRWALKTLAAPPTNTGAWVAAYRIASASIAEAHRGIVRPVRTCIDQQGQVGLGATAANREYRSGQIRSTEMFMVARCEVAHNPR